MFAFHAWAEGGLWYAWMVDDPEIFYPSDYDVAVLSINAPTGTIPLEVEVTPNVTVKNLGGTTVTFDVTFKIFDAGKDEVYSSTATVTDLVYGETQDVMFDAWIPPAEGVYTTVAYTELVGDEDPTNDTMYGEPVVVLPPLGYEEGFEAAVIPPPAWQQYILGAPESPGWQVYTGTEDWTYVETPPIEGNYAIGHNDDDLPTSAEDWLVTPLLNVNAGARLTFYHMTNYAPNFTEYRGVWVSTGARDPSAGDYVEVLDMSSMASDEEWTLVDIDLSPYEGQAIFIGFKYVGNYADEWFIDGVKGYGLTIGEMPWDVSIPTPEIGGVADATEGAAVSMSIQVYNSSTSPGPTDLRAIMRMVYGPTGAIVFNDFRDVTIDPGESQTVYFDEWVPTQPGDYIGTVVLQTELDPNLSNNVLVDTFTVAAKLGVVELPTMYDLTVKTLSIGAVHFNYALPKASNIELTIYDAMGRTVYEVSRMEGAGYGDITVQLGSGVYFYRYIGGEYTRSGKIVIFK